MDALLQDIRIGLRRLLRSRAFAAMAIGTLAIGIGANTAVFTLINAVQLRPLPFVAPDRLVDVYEHNPVEVCQGCGVGTSYANYLDWQRSARSFAGMAAYDEVNAAIRLGEGARKRYIGQVSAELFPLLGVAPLRGRFFTPDEELARGAKVALISEHLALASFGPDTNPIGRTLHVDGEAFQIVGVMPERFMFPERAELWVPLAPAAAGMRRDERSIGVVARLANGVAMEQAAAELTAIGRQLAIQYPAEQKGWNAYLTSLHEDMASDYTSTGTLLLGAVACVLLIVCANLANLLLVRASSRRVELAVRAALGATRLRLARQVLVEAMLVSLAGGALGLIVALWGVQLMHGLAADALPRWIRYDMDWRVFSFAFGLSVLTGLVFGVLPARVAARANVNDVLKDGGRGATGSPGRVRAREVLVVLQMAVAFALVATAGLLTKTMLRTRTFDMGYDIRGLMRADVGVSGARYQDGTAIATFSSELLSELQRGPGVKSAAMSGLHILNWPGTPHQDIAIDDVPVEKSATALHHVQAVTPTYFETMGLSLVSGRGFTNTDVPGARRVAIVSGTLARSLWGDRTATGKHIRIGTDDWTVVGVVGDMRESPLGTGFSPLLYFPLAQLPLRHPAGQGLTVTVRIAPGATSIPKLLNSVLQRIDPNVTAENVISVEEGLRQWQRPVQTMAMFAAALGTFACLLAALGIYGVIAYVVSQRTHEIGIRMALGASVADVRRMIMKHGFMLAITGTAIGIAGAGAFAQTLGYLLFGVSPVDPVVYALVAIGFMSIALLGAYLPARYASRVDPMEALRAE